MEQRAELTQEEMSAVLAHRVHVLYGMTVEEYKAARANGTLPDHPGSYVIEGQCACGSGLIGADETEVVARWNRRTPKAVQRKPLTRQQLREAFHKETGCTLGGDIDLAERVCGVVERAHGITTNGRKDAP